MFVGFIRRIERCQACEEYNLHLLCSKHADLGQTMIGSIQGGARIGAFLHEQEAPYV